MKKLDFNIQMFGDEGGFDPSAYNKLKGNYDKEVLAINELLKSNQDILKTFNKVAGSPKLSADTKTTIGYLQQGIDECRLYFNSVKRWSAEFVSVIYKFIGVKLESLSSSIDETILDEISESYNESFVGVQKLGDVDTFVTDLTSVATNLKNALETVSEDVTDADNSMPLEIHQKLAETVSTSDANAIEAFDKFYQGLTQTADEFKKQLQSAISDLSSAASGTGGTTR